jgi:hypothetical protein
VNSIASSVPVSVVESDLGLVLEVRSVEASLVFAKVSDVPSVEPVVVAQADIKDKTANNNTRRKDKEVIEFMAFSFSI